MVGKSGEPLLWKTDGSNDDDGDDDDDDDYVDGRRSRTEKPSRPCLAL